MPKDNICCGKCCSIGWHKHADCTCNRYGYMCSCHMTPPAREDGNLTVKNFICSEHGKIKPTPTCPKCSPKVPESWEERFDKLTMYDGAYTFQPKSVLKYFIRTLLKEEKEKIITLIATHNFLKPNIHRGVEDLIAKIKSNE